MIPRKVTIHCSDTPNGKRVDISEIRRWHVEGNGWDDVGYHMVIQPDGEVQNGRPLNVQGAHVFGHNKDNVGICLIGRDKFGSCQLAALECRLDSLKMTYDIPAWEIWAHYQFNSKKRCPGMTIQRIICWYVMKDDKAIEPYLIKNII